MSSHARRAAMGRFGVIPARLTGRRVGAFGPAHLTMQLILIAVIDRRLRPLSGVTLHRGSCGAAGACPRCTGPMGGFNRPVGQVVPVTSLARSLVGRKEQWAACDLFSQGKPVSVFMELTGNGPVSCCCCMAPHAPHPDNCATQWSPAVCRVAQLNKHTYTCGVCVVINYVAYKVQPELDVIVIITPLMDRPSMRAHTRSGSPSCFP